jgi:site-specific recombinase
MNLIEIIRKTNGDILGAVLFIILIIYFISIENKTFIENSLLASCTVALVVDSIITYKVLYTKPNKVNPC